MAVLGLLILIAVAIAVIAAVLRGGDSVRIDLDWFTIKTDAGVVFAAGAVTLLLFFIGLALLRRGLRKSRQRRAEAKELRKRAETAEEEARREREAHAAAADSTDAQHRAADGSDDHFDSTPRDR